MGNFKERGLSNFLLVSFFLLLACSQKQAEDIEQASATLFFDVEKAEQNFKALTTKNQWVFVGQLFQNNHSNQKELVDWFERKIEVLFSNPNEINHEVLFLVNNRLNKIDFIVAMNKLANATLALQTLSDFSISKAYATANKVYFFYFQRDKDSLSYYLQLLKAYNDQDNSGQFALDYYSGLGGLKELEGDFFEAIVSYTRALTLVGKTDTINKFILNQDLASLYLQMNFVDKAMHFANQALQYYPNDKVPVDYLNTFGSIYSKNQQFELANDFFGRAIEHAQKKKLPLMLAQAYANYGNLKRKEQNFAEAIKYISLSDSICDFEGLAFGNVINQINMAELFFDKKKYNEAISLLNKAASNIANFDIPKINMEYYLLASKIYDAVGEQNRANYFFRKYTIEKELYLGDLPRSIIAEWELATERELSAEEKNQLNLKIQAEIKRQYFMLVLLLVVFIFGGLFYFFFHRRALIDKQIAFLEKEKMAHKLELKSKEMLSESLNNIQITHVKSNLLKDLDVLVKGLPSEHQKQFRSLQNMLRTAIKEKFSVEFEKRFLGVYEEFYDKLKLIAPELSPTELKVCGLIRLNISSKDIALLTNRSLGTIENTRIKIRKKLNIEPEVNLQQFLLNI